MAAGGKPFVRYSGFPSDLTTSVLVHCKKQHSFPIQNVTFTLHDKCLSLVGQFCNVLNRRHFVLASKSFFCSTSKSITEHLSRNLGSNISSEENRYTDDVNGILFNTIDIDSWEEKLFPYVSEKDVATAFLVSNGRCILNLKSASSFTYSSSEFQVQKSIAHSLLLDPCSTDNVGSFFWNSISDTNFCLLPQAGKGYGCRERIKWPRALDRGLLSDLKSPCECLEKLHWFGKLLIHQIYRRIRSIGEFPVVSSALHGNIAALEVISEKYQQRAVNNISNILMKGDLIAELTPDKISKLLNVGSDKDCNNFADSMNNLHRNSDRRGTASVLRQSALLTPARFHQSMKYILNSNSSLQEPVLPISSTLAKVSGKCKSDDKSMKQVTGPLGREESVLPISSTLGKKSGNCKFDDRSIEQVAGPLGSEESLRKDTRLQQTSSMSLFPKMGNNALAGALAGMFVSLWLHPIDTVKTIIQSRTVGHRLLFHNLGSIMSERGIAGLYRGIGSNLASSAPISGIYTFTYESVKAALLPHLAKEYHAFAHCAAGGCASIATSFIYTPSECVKQQMQVGSQYCNSWKALTGILEKGGFPLLYAGWGAVLCRNVPQSVIKFYTYEGLKHLALRRHSAEAHLSTLQTLAFGGFAGSTAALFTTPFDVIKTRLQTQILGSPTYYEGVFQAFQHIARHEGLGGLYRGLLPRLVIYISQGALFFASYEFFKRVLAIEVRRLSIQTSQSRGTNNIGQSAVVEST